MAQLRIVMTADEARAFRAYQKMLDKEKQLGSASEETGRKSRKGMQESEGGIQRLMGSVKSYAAGLMGAGGVLMAWQAISAELDNVIEKQKRATATQVTAANAEQALLRNLPDASAAEIRGITDNLRKIARETNIEYQYLVQAAATALSASGGNQPGSMKTIDMMARYYPDDPSALPEGAGGILDISKASGTDDPIVNLAYMLLAAARGRVTQTNQQIENIPASIVTAANFGADVATGVALFSSWTNASTDRSGAETKTAITRVAGEQLRDFFIENSKMLRSQYGVDSDALDMHGRFETLFQNPELAQQFVGGATIRAGSRAAVEQFFLNPDSAVRAEYYKVRGEVPTTPAAAEAFIEQAIANRALAPNEPAAIAQRTLRGGIQEAQLGDPMEGVVGAIRAELILYLAELGMSAMEQKVRGFLGKLKAGHLTHMEVVDQTIALLEAQRDDRLRATQPAYTGRWIASTGIGEGGVYGVGTVTYDRREVPRTPSEQDISQAENLQRRIDDLKTARDMAARQNELMERHTRALEENTEALRTSNIFSGRITQHQAEYVKASPPMVSRAMTRPLAAQVE